MPRTIGYGSGSPAGIPDYRPLNPWGRAMPQRPSVQAPQREALYQVFVEDKSGALTALGPKWSEAYAGELAEKINRAILAGTWTETGMAYVRMVKAGDPPPDTRTIGDILKGVSNGG